MENFYKELLEKFKSRELGVWSIGNDTMNRTCLKKIRGSYGTEYEDYSFMGM